MKKNKAMAIRNASRTTKLSKLLREKKLPSSGLKLDLACGSNKTAGYIGVDSYRTGDVDVVHDLLTFPWPFSDDQVDEIVCNHFLEHIPGILYFKNGANGYFCEYPRFRFMDELYRVLKPGGKATFVTPFYLSVRAHQDPTHVLPGISEYTFQYFNKGWRDVNKLGHYPVQCDFDWQWSLSIGAAYSGRSKEYIDNAIHSVPNVVSDIIVTVTSRKGQDPAPVA